MLSNKYFYHTIKWSDNIQKVYYKTYKVGDNTTSYEDIFLGEILITLTPPQMKYYVKTFKIVFNPPEGIFQQISGFLSYKSEQDIIFGVSSVFNTEEEARLSIKKRNIKDIIK